MYNAHRCMNEICMLVVLSFFHEFVDGIFPLFIWIVFYLRNRYEPQTNSKVTMGFVQRQLTIFVLLCDLYNYFVLSPEFLLWHSTSQYHFCLMLPSFIFFFIRFCFHENCILNLMFHCKRSFGVKVLCLFLVKKIQRIDMK